MSNQDANASGGAWENAALGGLAAAAYAGFLTLAYFGGAPAVSVGSASAAVLPPGAVAAGAAQPGAQAGERVVPMTASAVSSAVVRPESVDLVSPGAGPPQALNPHLEFLVKIEGDDVIALRDAFLSDPDGARVRFKAMADEREAFRNLRLKRITYGGELTVEWIGAAPKSADDADAISKAVIDRLKSAPGVVYAEPNLVGWKEQEQP